MFCLPYRMDPTFRRRGDGCARFRGCKKDEVREKVMGLSSVTAQSERICEEGCPASWWGPQ